MFDIKGEAISRYGKRVNISGLALHCELMAAPLRAASPPPPSPSDSAGDSADDLHLHFPQPPPIAPALRRMRSAPWHFPDPPLPDRRHSAALYPPPCISPRRPDPLPPPPPPPSIPLPRLPRIIRKVTSMRSEIRHDPVVESHRPVPKVRSLKFLSRSIGVPPSAAQPSDQGARKRTWSLSRPSRFQYPTDAPQARPSYTNWNVPAGDHFDMDRMPSDYAAYSVPYRDVLVRRPGCSTEDPFSLGLAPPFVTGAMRESDLNSFYPYSSTNYSEGGSVHNMNSNSPPRDRLLQRASQRFYRIDSSRRRNASSGTLLHGAKSFINITPERGKNGKKKKSRLETNGPADGSGKHVGSSMKEKGQKMKRLLARASTGVVDWGRQLTGKSAKSMATSSTSGSLVPLTGKQS